MNLLKQFLFLNVLLFSTTYSFSQCFEIESILVDACGTVEGENEMVRFKIGNSDLCSNDLTVNWPSANNWLGLTQNATTAQATTDLNATILSCGHLIEPTSCVLPANSTVILVTSTDIDVTANSFANLGDTIYIIYQTAGNTNGHFKNYDSSPNLKTLSMSFSAPVGCSDQVTYDANDLININGTSGGNSADKNGATVNFTSTGIPTYINDGCQAPFDPFVVELTATEVVSGTTTICPGDIIEVNVSVTGNYQEIIWSGNNGTFNNQDVVSTNYNSALTDNSAFYLYVSIVSPCNVILKDSILFTINQTPIVNSAGPFTTLSGTQNMTANMAGGTWSAVCGGCINSTTGVFDPAVSGEGSFQICYDAGCGQNCITVVVDDNCTMTHTITSSNPTCNSGIDGDVTLSVLNSVGTVSCIITDETNTQINAANNILTANNLSQGWYYFTFTDDLCTLFDSIYLDDPDEFIVNYTVIDPTCYNVANGIAFVDTVLNYQGETDYNQLTFSWYAVEMNQPIINDTLYNLSNLDYSLTVTDSAGCSQIITFTIEYPEEVKVNLAVLQPSVCRSTDYEFNNGGGQIYATVSGGGNGNGQGTQFTPPLGYIHWTELSTGDTENTSTWGDLNPGYYEFEVKNDLGCIVKDTIYLDVLNPIANFTLTSNNFTSAYEGTANVEIELTNQSENYSFANNLSYVNSNSTPLDTNFYWTFGYPNGQYDILIGGINTTLHIPFTTEGEYDVCLVVEENLFHCKDSVCQTIIIHDQPKLIIPNVFTPGEDGVNDYFYFPNSAIIDFSCKVYNRWGNQVFEFTSINDKWDGKHYLMDSDCVEGVYFYTYIGKSSNNTEYKGQGNIHLIRNK